MMTLEDLLEANRAWSEKVRGSEPRLLERLAEKQTPSFLWIGCSDSRVPAGMVTGTPPGTLFVHRNIANLAGGDSASLAVIQYAVEVLEVGHIVVCGHHGCGGIKAAMGDTPPGHVGEWIAPIRNTYGKHRARIDAIPDPEERADLLSELNVREQVDRLSRVEYVRRAWQSGKDLHLHGIVYSLAGGRLRNLDCSRSAS